MGKILVTGGNGLLGRYVVNALEGEHDIAIADRKGDDPRQVHGPVDVLDLQAIQNYVTGQDTIVHLAAIDAAVPAAPKDYFQTNVMAAWNILHAGYEAGVRQFVLCSSASVYGVRGDALGSRSINPGRSRRNQGRGLGAGLIGGDRQAGGARL